MTTHQYRTEDGAYVGSVYYDAPHLDGPGYTRVERPEGANRFDEATETWSTALDFRGQTWHNPETGDTLHFVLIGEHPPEGYVPGPPHPTAAEELRSARDAHWANIKHARDAAEFGVFYWGGHMFDGTIDSQRRLAMAEQAAQRAVAAGLSPTIDWTLADNTAVTLSAQDVIDAFAAMTNSIRAAHDKARTLRAQIEAATSAGELEAITWE